MHNEEIEDLGVYCDIEYQKLFEDEWDFNRISNFASKDLNY